MMKPNYWSCQECPQWDDVNGCWADMISLDKCPVIGGDGVFDGELYDLSQEESK